MREYITNKKGEPMSSVYFSDNHLNNNDVGNIKKFYSGTELLNKLASIPACQQLLDKAQQVIQSENLPPLEVRLEKTPNGFSCDQRQNVLVINPDASNQLRWALRCVISLIKFPKNKKLYNSCYRGSYATPDEYVTAQAYLEFRKTQIVNNTLKEMKEQDRKFFYVSSPFDDKNFDIFFNQLSPKWKKFHENVWVKNNLLSQIASSTLGQDLYLEAQKVIKERQWNRLEIHLEEIEGGFKAQQVKNIIRIKPDLPYSEQFALCIFELTNVIHFKARLDAWKNSDNAEHYAKSVELLEYKGLQMIMPIVDQINTLNQKKLFIDKDIWPDCTLSFEEYYETLEPEHINFYRKGWQRKLQ